jgi:hypothetical protein
MALEDMIIAQGYLTELGEDRINHLLDLMEDPSLPTSTDTLLALKRFLKGLEHEFGEDHPAVLQVRAALSLQPDIRAASLFKNPGMRIS